MSVDKLEARINNVIDDSDDVTQGEVIAALLLVLGPVLASIQCRDCREIQARAAKETLADVTEFALKAPSDLEHNGHVH